MSSLGTTCPSNKTNKLTNKITWKLNLPSGSGVVLLVGGAVVLVITGGIPTMDDALMLRSPSFPF